MNVLAGILLLVAAQLQPAPPSAAGVSPESAPPPTMLNVLGLIGSGEGQAAQQIPKELEPVESLLKELPFGRFQLENQAQEEMSIGAPIEVPVTDTYTLRVLPEEKTEDNQYLVDVKVLTQDGVTAVSARGKLPLEKPVVLRGLEAPEGELILALVLTQDNEGGGQGKSNEQNQEQKQDDQEKKDQDQQQDQDQKQPDQQQQDQQTGEREQQDQEQPPQDQSEQQEAQQPPEEQRKPENIEAILQHLEQMDRREQRSLVQERDVRKIPGEWW